MANKKPSALTAALALDGTEISHIVQGGNSRKKTEAQGRTYALAPFSANGIAVRTAAETFAARTITGTANEVTVTNGSGTAGDPTISLPSTLAFSGKSITGSPQIDGINLGHASDTTILRSAAGDVTIEGNVVYRAGGTDVALADGGLGASLVDPNADRILFWDDSAGQVTWLSLDPGLEISGTTLQMARGTSFPGSPANGDRFLRTDRNIEYFYDGTGTRWLSTQIHSLHVVAPTNLMPTTSSQEYYSVNPWWNEYDIYVLKGKAAGYNTATTATNYFTYQFRTWNAGVASNLGSSASAQNDTQNAFVAKEVTINAVVASDVEVISFLFTETGTASSSLTSGINYRLIG